MEGAPKKASLLDGKEYAVLFRFTEGCWGVLSPPAARCEVRLGMPKPFPKATVGLSGVDSCRLLLSFTAVLVLLELALALVLILTWRGAATSFVFVAV